jgi:extradiol dioxygenase
MIRALSYIGIESPTYGEWLTFGPEILGAEIAEPGPDGAVRLRVDDAVHRIVVHPGDHDDLAYLGWDVGDAASLDDLAARLEREDIEVHRGDAELAELRAVAAVAWFRDPFGFRHELSHGLRNGAPFAPGRPMHGFVTGAGGLGHAVLIVPDLDIAERFFTGILGLEPTDSVEAGLSIRFLHCNPRHHSLAYALVPGMVGMHHLMLEVRALDDVGAALDLVIERGIPLAMNLGQHTNDLMTSFYVRTPSGFEIEYGYGGALVDDENWHVGSYDTQSIWGHEPPADGPLFPSILRPADPTGATA